MSETVRYRVGNWEVIPLQCQLTCGDRVHHLEPKVMQLLVCLAENPGEVMTRDELQDTIWDTVVVSDHALTRLVSQLRGALDDPEANESFIETIPKTGYRLVAPVEQIVPGSAGKPAPSAEGGRRPVPLLIATALVLASVISVVLLVAEPRPPAPPELTMLTSEPGIENHPSVSPSGGIVLFNSNLDGDRGFELSLVSIDGAERRQLTEGPGHDVYPRWSVSGEQVRFLQFDAENNCEIRAISVVSDLQSIVQACPEGVRHGWDWASDDELMVFSESVEGGHHSRIRAHDQRTGRVWNLTTPESGESDLNPRLSPNRRHVAFVRAGNMWDTSLWVASVDGNSSARRLTPRGYAIAGMDWLPDSSGLVFSSDLSGRYQIWQVDLDEPEPRWLAIPGINDPSAPVVAPDGRQMLLVDWDYDFNLHMVDLNGEDDQGPLSASQRWDFNPMPSPDASQIAFVSNRSGHDEFWLADADGTNPRQLTRLRGLHIGHYDWLPDGSTIVFSGNQAGRHDIHQVRLTDGSVSKLTESGDNRAPSVALDGSGFYFGSRRSGNWQIHFRRFESDSDELVQVTADGGYHGREVEAGGFVFSKPHGSSLHYLASPSAETVVLAEGYEAYSAGAWDLRDGILYFLARDEGHSLAIKRQRVPDGEIELVRSLQSSALGGLPGFRLTADGDHLWLSIADTIESEIVRVDGLQLR